MTRNILFDATRLLSRTERDAPTGVDRVCLAYAEWLLGLSGVQVQPVRSRKGELLAVDEAWFKDEIRALRERWAGTQASAAECERNLMSAVNAPRETRRGVRSPQPTPSEGAPRRRLRIWRQLLRSSLMQGSPGRPLYFNIGHTGMDDARILRRLAQSGAECIVFLHDLIPITHPEFCRPGDGDRHRTRVLTALRHATRILVNSHYTAEQLTTFAAAEGFLPPPIHVAHLGLEPIFHRTAATDPAKPYFVHVGTIEARKNLAFLLAVWRRLDETGHGEVPQLVLVGRYGWENEAVLDYLERSPGLQALVHHVTDLPDNALVRLMTGARAVLAPSSVEGFDLPALEACAVGAPLIASDIPAHRELVPQARLIDPLDGLGWLVAIQEAGTQRPLPPTQATTTWPEHFRAVALHTGLEPTPLDPA